MSIRRKFLEGGSTSVSTFLSNVDQSLPNFKVMMRSNMCHIRRLLFKIDAYLEDYKPLYISRF